MELLFSLFGLFIFIHSVVSIQPPSLFSTDCKYVASIGDTRTDIVPIDVCYQSTDPGLFGTLSSSKWKCEFNNDTNITAPVNYRYTDDECANGESISNFVSAGAFNCDSDAITCPIVSFYEAGIDPCPDEWNKSIITNTTIINNTETFTPINHYIYAMNLCKNGSVYTCEGAMLYEWIYEDSACQNYVEYQIYEQTSLKCDTGLKIEIEACNMTNVNDPFAPTISPTMHPSDTPTTSFPTSSPTDESGAYELSHRCLVFNSFLCFVLFFV